MSTGAPPPDLPLWETEGDTKTFEVDGYHCLILRNPTFGSLNGYVALPPGHSLHGVNHNKINVPVHYGWTYSDREPPQGFGDPDQGYWFIGFDCAHFTDFQPGLVRLLSARFRAMAPGIDKSSYKSMDFVETELRNAVAHMGEYPKAGQPEST